MRKHHLKSNSKVSLNFIVKHEQELNEKLTPNQKNVELFNFPYN